MTLETETMKVLVINASANKERSTTLKLTKTFLEGLEVEASEVEFVTTIGLNINPCRACYACWFKTSGKFFARPDAATVDDKCMEPDVKVNLDDKDASWQYIIEHYGNN